MKPWIMSPNEVTKNSFLWNLLLNYVTKEKKFVEEFANAEDPDAVDDDCFEWLAYHMCNCRLIEQGASRTKFQTVVLSVLKTIEASQKLN